MQGRVTLASVGMLLAIGVMVWAGGVSADQPPPAYYLALGDSVAAGQGASRPDRFGYVGLFRRSFQADHQGKERFANLAVPGESSATFLGGQMARALATPSMTRTQIYKW